MKKSKYFLRKIMLSKRNSDKFFYRIKIFTFFSPLIIISLIKEVTFAFMIFFVNAFICELLINIVRVLNLYKIINVKNADEMKLVKQVMSIFICTIISAIAILIANNVDHLALIEAIKGY